MKTYVTIYEDYSHGTDVHLGRRHFIQEYMDIAVDELVHALGYFLDSETEHEFIVEVYVDQILKAVADTYSAEEIPEAVMNILSEDLVGVVIQSEIVQEKLLTAQPRLKTPFLHSLVDESLKIVFGRSFSVETRIKTAEKYLVPLTL